MHPSQKQLSQHAIISLKGKRDTPPPHTHTRGLQDPSRQCLEAGVGEGTGEDNTERS